MKIFEIKNFVCIDDFFVVIYLMVLGKLIKEFLSFFVCKSFVFVCFFGGGNMVFVKNDKCDGFVG